MVGIYFILETHSPEYTWQAFRVVNAFKQRCIMVVMRYPREQSSWDQHGAHLGPAGPRWAHTGPMNPVIRDPIICTHHWVHDGNDNRQEFSWHIEAWTKRPTFWQSISSNVNHWLTIISTIMQLYSPYARCVVLLTTFTLQVPRIREPFQKQVRLY